MPRYIVSLSVVAVVAVAASAAVTMFLPSLLPHAAGLASTSTPSPGTRTINHQGVVAVNGIPFNGTGTFYFAIIDPDTPMTCNRWTNDVGYIAPASATSAQPANGVSLMVTNGIYSVRLGDVNLDPAHMKPIPSSIFSKNNLQLRIWFDDGTNGVQLLSPDQPLCSAPYALGGPGMCPIGSIVPWHKNMPYWGTGTPTAQSATPALPDGWLECNGGTISDPTSPYNGMSLPNLNNTPSGYTGGGYFLRGGTGSGVKQDGTLHYNLPRGRVVMDATDGLPWVYSSDGSTGVAGKQFERGYPPIDTVEGWFSGNYMYSRPVNMSVVWIMRIK